MKKTLFIFAAAILSVQAFAFDSEASLKPNGASEYTKIEYSDLARFFDKHGFQNTEECTHQTDFVVNDTDSCVHTDFRESIPDQE